MIELHFYSGKGYGVSRIFEDDDYYISTGVDADGQRVTIVDLKKLGIHLVGDEELHVGIQIEMGMPLPLIGQESLRFIFKRLTPEKFIELIEGLTQDRWTAGYKAGQTEIQTGLRELLGVK